MHYQRARLCQRSRAERVGGFGLRDWLGKAESQGYQAFPPLIMSVAATVPTWQKQRSSRRRLKHAEGETKLQFLTELSRSRWQWKALVSLK